MFFEAADNLLKAMDILYRYSEQISKHHDKFVTYHHSLMTSIKDFYNGNGYK